MKTYLCRWPNGDVSVVTAPNKAGAVWLLDEVDSADFGMLTEITQFAAHFKLKERVSNTDDEVPLTLQVFNENFAYSLADVYPEYYKALQEVNETELYTEGDLAKLDAALDTERERLKDSYKGLTDAQFDRVFNLQ